MPAHSTVTVHMCEIYGLTPQECFAAEPCAKCDVRRDEHADQEAQSGLPALDITDHAFVAPSALAQEA